VEKNRLYYGDNLAVAEDDKYQFQWWALSLAGARPLEKKKRADQGIDGRLYFHDEAKGGTTKQIIFSVKAGHLLATHVRDLRGVIEREKAEIGVLISMEPPTKPMLKEAAEAGLYQPPGMTDKYPRIQILHIAELPRREKDRLSSLRHRYHVQKGPQIPQSCRRTDSARSRRNRRTVLARWGCCPAKFSTEKYISFL
jgi:hypothetical protein